MLGTAAKLAGRGLGAGAKGLNAARGWGPAAFGRGVAMFGGAKAGFIAAHGASGLIKGAALGGAMSIATGNTDWLPLMAGAGAYRGASRAMIAANTTIKGTGALNPGRLTRNMALGSAVGLATDNPNWAVYGAVGLPAAGAIGKMMFNPRGAGTFLKGVAQIPFSPRSAARTFEGLTIMQAGAAPMAMGTAAGLGWGGYKLMTRDFDKRPNDLNSGIYPGGVAPLHPGRGQGIPNDNLNTEGLTLALHKNARKTRHM